MNQIEKNKYHETKSHSSEEFLFNTYPCSIPTDFPSVPLHWHNDMELIVIKHGSAKVTLNLTPHQLSAGDILVVLPENLHSIDCAIGDRLEYENIIFKKELLSFATNDITMSKYLTPFFNGDFPIVTHVHMGYSFYSHFVKIINKLNVPYYIVIGNHDVFKQNGLSKAHYLEIIKNYNYFYKYKKPNYVFKQNGFVFIVLDGAKEVIPGSNGFYKDNTLSWLDKQLKKYKKDPVIIFQHFPIVMTKERPTHTVYQKDKYIDILDKHDNVISIIEGHLHINDEVMRNGVYHITSPTLLSTPPVYKIITVSTTKGFSPMIYTELKEVEMPKSQE